jgi:hypothetical protein
MVVCALAGEPFTGSVASETSTGRSPGLVR